jgi:ribosome-binding protein aMBF1 (putative translation factor)
VDDARLDPVIWDVSQGRAAQKQRLLGDLFPAQLREGATGGVFGSLPCESVDWRTEGDSGNQTGREQAKAIKHEKQYGIAKAQARRFQEAVAELAGQARPSNISARLWNIGREAGRRQMEELRQQVESYEQLNAGRSKAVVLEGVEDLPKAMVRARIDAGITQEGLARRLGVKPQQVQRYEATESESARFARILTAL